MSGDGHELGGQECGPGRRLGQDHAGRAAFLLPGHGTHAQQQRADDAELREVLEDLGEVALQGRRRDRKGHASALGADRVEDLLEVAVRQRAENSEEDEDRRDRDQAARTELLAQLFGEEYSEAHHRRPLASRPHTGTLTGGATAISGRSATSRRNTSSRLGRARSKRARRHATAGDRRQDRRTRDLGIVDEDSQRVRRGLDLADPGLPAQQAGQPIECAGLLRLGLQLVDRLGISIEELVYRTLDHEMAHVQDGHAVADPFHVVEDVGAHEDRGRPPQPRHDLQDVAPSFRVQRADGLVEEEDAGLIDQRLPDPEPLAHPARVAADPTVGGARQADDLEHLADALLELAAVQSVELADHVQQLAAAHPAVEPRVLIQVADVAGQPAVRGADVDAGHLAGSIGRPGEAGEKSERRGLSGAVGSEEAEDAAARDRQAEMVQGHDSTRVALGQRGGGDGGCGRLALGRRRELGPGGQDPVDRLRGRRRPHALVALRAARLVASHEEVDERADDVEEGDDQGPHDLAVAPNPPVFLEEVVQGIEHQPEFQDDEWDHQEGDGLGIERLRHAWILARGRWCPQRRGA